MKFVRKALVASGLLLAGLVAVLGGKSALTKSRQVAVVPAAVAALSESEQQQAAQRLGRVLQFKTVSQEGQPPATDELRAMQAYLQQTFPAFHAAAQLERVSDLSLLYTWKGQDAGAQSYLLLAHQDVVPVEVGTEGRWTQPPFSGAVADGFVWGRGALDDKFNIVAMLEAAEQLARTGWKPRRTIYFAFGHDEELSGLLGAKKISELLQQRGVHLDFVLDEGMAITQDILPGIHAPVALIGLAEKGYLTVELTVESAGGHSSMPPAHSAVGILSRAVRSVEDQQMAAALRPPASLLFEYLGPEMPQPLKLVFTNTWLLKPVLLGQLLQGHSTAAMVRTTTAATMIEGSPKDNVLPQRARAAINFRVLPGDTTEQVLAHVRAAVDDPQVKVSAIERSRGEATPISAETAASFVAIARTVRSLVPGAVVAPALMLGQSDSRHFVQIASQTYRFMPAVFRPEDLDRTHGTNERISIANYADSIRFYGQLLRTVDDEK